MAVNAHVELRQRRTKLDDLLTYTGPLADSEQEEFVGLMESEAVSSQISNPFGPHAAGSMLHGKRKAKALFLFLTALPMTLFPGLTAYTPDSERVTTQIISCAGEPLPAMADSDGRAVADTGHSHVRCWGSAVPAPLGPEAPCFLPW